MQNPIAHSKSANKGKFSKTIIIFELFMKNI